MHNRTAAYQEPRTFLPEGIRTSAPIMTRVISPYRGLSRTFLGYFPNILFLQFILYWFIFVSDAFIYVFDSFYAFPMYFMRFQLIFMRFSMNSLADSCAGPGPGPGPSALDMLYITKRQCLSRFQGFPWSQLWMSVVPSAQVPIYTRTPHWIAIPAPRCGGLFNEFGMKVGISYSRGCLF